MTEKFSQPRTLILEHDRKIHNNERWHGSISSYQTEHKMSKLEVAFVEFDRTMTTTNIKFIGHVHHVSVRRC